MEAHRPEDLLLPRPRRVRHGAGAVPALTIGRSLRIAGESPETARAVRALQRGLERAGLALHRSEEQAGDEVEQRAGDREAFPVEFALEAEGDLLPGPEAYRLTLEPSSKRPAGRARLVARSESGLAHAAATLVQWLALHARPPQRQEPLHVPPVSIEDAPDFPVRGYCLDISRDRVPRTSELYALVDRLEAWKLNQLQLYTEHTFAYAEHELVWRDASPITPDEVRALDAYCAERGVELVPNQNCFGHLHRWLKHAPYRDLAECPEGTDHPFLHPSARAQGVREPWSLCPTDPRSLEFVAGLLDELLPCFTSARVNVGCDETIDLGEGRSRAACKALGAGRVYADFVAGVDALVRERGRQSLVWADVALRQGDAADTIGSGPDAGLPRDAVAVVWGYEADHPFEAQCARLAELGHEFWVAPGTSSWNSLLGRLDNALANLASAARTGRAEGATGWLVTDWGDYGHWQPPSVSLPGLAAGAALGWNADDDDWTEPAVRLAPHLLQGAAADDTGLGASLARSLVELGRVAAAAGVLSPNASAPFLFLHHAAAAGLHERLTPFDSVGLLQAREALRAARAQLAETARLASSAALSRASREADLAARELDWAGRLADLGLAEGLARTASGEPDSAALDVGSREERAAGLRTAAREVGALWLERSRPGGLADSTARLEAAAAAVAARTH